MQAGTAEYALTAQDKTAAAFNSVAQKLEGLSDKADRVGKAFSTVGKVFGIAAGAAGIGMFVRAAMDAGNALNKIDAGKITQANESVEKAKKSFLGLATIVGAQLSPYIKMAADLFVKAMGDGEGFRRVMHAAFIGLVRAVGIFADVWRGIEAIWAGLKMSFVGLRLFILDGLSGIDQKIVDIANKMPGIHLQYSAGLKGATEAARAQFEQTRSEFDAIMAKPLPSTGMLAAVQQIDAAANKQTAVLAKQAAADDARTAVAREKAKEQRAAEVEEDIVIETMSGEVKYKIGEMQEKKELARLSAFQKVKGGMEKMANTETFRATSTFLSNASGLMQSERKKEFEIGKKAAIGQALIGTYLGVTEALKAPWFMQPALIATALATGMMQVRQIKSQKFGGGGAANVGASPSMAVSSTGLPDSGASQAPAYGEAPMLPQSSSSSAPARNVVIQVGSDTGMVSMDWVRNKLAPAMQEAAGDGVKFMVA